MKRESSFRVLEVKNDTEYIFSVESFRKIFLSFLEENKMSGTKYTKTKLYGNRFISGWILKPRLIPHN